MRRWLRQRGMPSVPTTSMGDVAFLLIIFFVLCSRFAQEKAKIQAPRAREVDELQEGQISVTIDAEGVIYVQGRKVDNADWVKDQVAHLVGGKKSEQARTVMFRCDRSVSKKIFEPVVEAIAEGGGLIAAVGEKGTAKTTPRAPSVPAGQAKERERAEEPGPAP